MGTTLTRHSHSYLSTHMNPQDTAQPIDIIPYNMPMLVIDDPPRKAVLKQEQPYTTQPIDIISDNMPMVVSDDPPRKAVLKQEQPYTTQPIDITSDNMPMVVSDDPPRKVDLKQEQPSTSTKKRSVTTRDGNPKKQKKQKKQKIDNETYSDVDDFLTRMAADLV